MLRHVVVLVCYAALALLMTWPMAARFFSHVPGDGIDDPSLAWNLWWIKHAFVDQPQNPFVSAWQFWPVGINLAFYTLTVLNGLLGIPLQLVLGLIPTYNLLLLSSFALSGLGAYLLCLDFLAQGERAKPGTLDQGKRGNLHSSDRRAALLAAFLGGALYAFASAKLFYAALGQGNIASSQWIPFALLYMLRATRPEGRGRDALLAALFLIMQAYAELTYASFLLIFAGLALLWGVYLQTRWRRGTAQMRNSIRGGPLSSLAGRFALLSILFLVGIAPMLANMLPDLRAEGDLFASGGGFADLFSADLAGYGLPTQLHPVLGGLVRSVANNSEPRANGSYFPVNKGQHIYLGYTAVLLASVAVWRGRRRPGLWFWGAVALLFFSLTLGPSLRVLGYDLGVPLPFSVVSRLPFFEGNRYPSRYSVMLLASLAPLVAMGFRSWRRGSRPVVFGLLLVVLLFEHLSVPLPMFDLRVPALYDRVAVETGDFALLEVPPGWRNGARVAGKKDIVIMQELWNQTLHGKRLLGGNTSRNPEFKFQYFSEDPTLSLLIAYTNASDLPQHTALRSMLASRGITEADRLRAQVWAALLNVRFLMVHRDKVPAQMERVLRELWPLSLVGEAGDLALYEIAGTLPRPREYAIGDDQGRPVLAEGWSSPGGWELPGSNGRTGVYAQRKEVRMLLPLGPEATALRLYGRAFAPNQIVTLITDGREIGSLALSEHFDWLAFALPADPGRPVLSDVRLRFSALVPIEQVGQGPWPVGKTQAESEASLLVRSAGEETGNFAHIYVEGKDLATGGRGYNLVALDPANGQLLASAAFDTHGDPRASSELASWVAGLPPGAIVAGAVKDEASMNLNGEAIEALQSLGVATDLRNRFRWGHAFVGAVGAPSGTASEALDGIRPAQVSVGLPVSNPEVAAAIAGVALGK
jgi:hypothetical protein